MALAITGSNSDYMIGKLNMALEIIQKYLGGLELTLSEAKIQVIYINRGKRKLTLETTIRDISIT